MAHSRRPHESPHAPRGTAQQSRPPDSRPGAGARRRSLGLPFAYSTEAAATAQRHDADEGVTHRRFRRQDNRTRLPQFLPDLGQRMLCTAHAVMELCLAHTVGNAVERAYVRSDLLDKRRTLMQQWGTLTNPTPADATRDPTCNHPLLLRCTPYCSAQPRNSVDIKQLKNLIALVEEGNAREAALRQHISQPGLSMSIKRLKESLKITLFQRGKSSPLTIALSSTSAPNSHWRSYIWVVLTYQACKTSPCDSALAKRATTALLAT